MGKLSELVKRDYDEEVQIIKEAGGNLWVKGIGIGVGLALLWAFDLFFTTPWTKTEIGMGMIFVVGYPFWDRAWERHKVANTMRHQREVRMEIKLNALLGIVNIKDGGE